MIDRPAGRRQLDLLVRTANALEPSRIPRPIRAEVTRSAKTADSGAHRRRRGAAARGRQ